MEQALGFENANFADRVKRSDAWGEVLRDLAFRVGTLTDAFGSVGSPLARADATLQSELGRLGEGVTELRKAADNVGRLAGKVMQRLFWLAVGVLILGGLGVLLSIFALIRLR